MRLEAQEAARAEIAKQPDRRAHMSRPCRQVALLPARPLADPGQRRAGRLLGRLAVHHAGEISGAGEADPEIRVLGHVVRVPGAQPLQRRPPDEHRGAAEGQRKAEPRHARQHQAEPGGVFDGEAAGDPAVRLVAESEARLHAGQLGRRAGEGLRDLAQLVGRRRSSAS